ncbi:integrase core domain-containing protein [Kyrpidia tusciae]|uniref:integrase core domain-containing protein n=1 Tax=Kyrpidia tusciae TaxID=33943 RepID=UPI00389944A2
MRKHYSASFKAQVVLELLREEKTVAQLASEYASPREARESIRTFIHHYNHERPHQSLGYHTPAEIYLKGMRPEDPIRPQVSTEHTYCGKESA